MKQILEKKIVKDICWEIELSKTKYWMINLIAQNLKTEQKLQNLLYLYEHNQWSPEALEHKIDELLLTKLNIDIEVFTNKSKWSKF
ncbi:hypothetical protein [Mycoplasma putrefaciens]|uniref:Uncharacterized protein n=1 Tax=Mycoplasma putrefaciens Mput9231 TaxID=1292033 RepID=M9WH57_9MOLU|nr:hypothetical protein [Mycoplasma putrefaciens]AGJ90724.1 Hypothetical protein MPUT9231_3000 [Mycoplasma putrefaciens Mput9231]